MCLYIQDMDIRKTAATDLPALTALHDAAFGTPFEGRLVRDLLAAGLGPLSLVAVEKDRILGHILFSPLTIEVGNETVRGLALAPLAVDPAHQKQGIGTALTKAGLVAAQQNGWEAVIVLGQPDYYQRFGFSPDLGAGFDSPFAGPYLMGLELARNSLSGQKGKIIYAEPFTKLMAGEAPGPA